VLIKASPLLDIQRGIRDLVSVQKVFVVSVSNDCKELLFLCKKDFDGEPDIVAIDLSNKAEKFEFTFSNEKNGEVEFSNPSTYLYEPNASIMKAGAFKLVGKAFSLSKIHPNTHFYTSKEIVTNFPGRIFRIIDSIKPDPTVMDNFLPGRTANVITRNYTTTPDQLKKRLKISDGGDLYVVGFSGRSKKYLVVAERIK
jgi:hypothetical protein